MKKWEKSIKSCKRKCEVCFALERLRKLEEWRYLSRKDWKKALKQYRFFKAIGAVS